MVNGLFPIKMDCVVVLPLEKLTPGFDPQMRVYCVAELLAEGGKLEIWTEEALFEPQILYVWEPLKSTGGARNEFGLEVGAMSGEFIPRYNIAIP
jgi:hypothetical protein